MNKLEITVEDVKNALNDSKHIIPVGILAITCPARNTEYLWRTLQDRLVTRKQFGKIVVKSKPDGAQVLLSDIARIELGTENYFNSTKKW